MKKVFYFSLMVMAMFVMAACSSSPSSPSDAMKKYSEYYLNRDFEKFVDGLAFKEEKDAAKIQEEKEALVALFKEKVTKKNEKNGGIKNFEVISEEIAEDGNTATVKMKCIYENGETEENDQKLIKQDGKWLMDSGK